MEEFEKEKEEIYQNAKNEFKETEKKLKEKFQALLEQKQTEIERINRDL
jgi:hypothetical protein